MENINLIPADQLRLAQEYDKTLVSLSKTLTGLVGPARQVSEELSKHSIDYKTLTELLNRMDNIEKKHVQTRTEIIKTYQQYEKAQERIVRATSDEVKQVQTLDKFLQSVTGHRDQNIQRLRLEQAALNAVQKEQRQLNKAFQSGSDTNAIQRKESLIERELQHKQAISELRIQLRSETKEMQSAAGSMNQLTQELGRLRSAYRSLNEEQRSSPEGLLLEDNIRLLDKEIKNLDANIGNYQRNVGNYTDGFRDLNRTVSLVNPSLGIVTSKITNLSTVKRGWMNINQQIVKSLGLTSRTASILQAGIVGLVIGGVMIGVKAFKDWREEMRQLADAQNDFIKPIIQERIELELLFNQLRKTNEGTRERIVVTDAIQAKYGDYLESQREEIKNLQDQEGAYRILTSAVIENARAKSMESSFSRIGEEYARSVSDSYRYSLNLINGIAGDHAETFFNDYRSVIERANGEFTDELKGFFHRINEINQGNVIPVNQLRAQTETILLAQREANEEVDRANQLYGAMASTLKIATQETNSLIEKQQQLLREAQKLPESTEEEIKLKNQRIKQIDDEISRLRNLGVLAKQQVKDINKVAQERIKIQQAEKKAFEDWINFQLDEESAVHAKIVASTARSYEDRLEALSLFMSQRRSIIKNNADSQTEGLIEGALSTGTFSSREEAEQALSTQIQLIRAKMWSEMAKIDEEGKKTTDSIVKGESERLVKQIESRLTGINVNLNLDETRELEGISTQLAQGLLMREEYETEREAIIRKYAKSRFEAEQSALLDMLELEELSEEEREKIAIQAGENIAKYSEELADAQIKENEREFENFKKIQEAKKKLISELISFSGALFSRNTENRLNELEKESEETDKWASDEQARIQRLEQAGVISKENADAQKAAVDYEAERRQEEIDQKRVEAQRKQAIFDKALSVTQSIINTAFAVTAAWRNPFTAPVMIPIIIATGAAQLATILAQPIPQYAKGTKDHAGGPAIVGDGGKRELVYMPGMGFFVTPKTPTITSLPKHSEVYPDFSKIAHNFIGTHHEGLSEAKIVNNIKLETKKTELLLAKNNKLMRALARGNASNQRRLSYLEYSRGGSNLIKW